MRKTLLFGALGFLPLYLLWGCTALGGSVEEINPELNLGKIQKIVYLNPDIYPDFSALQEPTNTAFFGAISNQLQRKRNIQVTRIDTPMDYENIDEELLADLCTNNMADIIIVPHIKYFKVGIGKYVLSNQVVVSLKSYTKKGEFISRVNYDTYAGNARLLGSAENSVKLGVEGALNKMFNALKKQKMIMNEVDKRP